ncbi:hypothetical protein LIER_04893 [Lithospermum erythrorhizon]|uniref:Zinc finger PHD-type domain-containing protein n=1 Tax=Lithospermum erythrorhizon TaxID=34254 RepID=A0AAV3NYD6_LITER
MKSRSHRLPIAETHDDWVDESWTVDCVCGVNFDDGEEMVNCDECGVWVHTRCSRYVKSEKSFACDKCKSKNSRNNDSEETEVAQLLVDLPNKTLRMDNLYPLNGPSQMPVKLYTQISTEKKVHVHGVPGGDPSLFAGLSSVFSPQLWKCTGYVPKKFNFQYKEFPSWDETETEQGEGRHHKESDNAVENENTAGVLFSLLKDSASVTPLRSSEGIKSPVEDGTAGKGAKSEHMRSSVENKDSSFARTALNKDSSLAQAVVVDSLKHKKKERGTSKDRHERKRTGIHEKGRDSKKKARIPSTTASMISNGGKQFEFYEDRGPKVTKVYTESSKSGDSMHPESADELSNGPGIRGINTNNDRRHAAADEHDVDDKKFDSFRCYTNSDGRLKEDNTLDQMASKMEKSHKVKEVGSVTLDSPNDNEGGSSCTIMAGFQKAQPVVEHLVVGDVSSSSGKNVVLKSEADKNLDVLNVHQSPSSEETLEVMKLSAQQIEVPAINLSENVKKSDLVITSSEISDQMQAEYKSTASGDNKKDDAQAGGCQSKAELPTGSGVRDGSSVHKPGSMGSDGSLGGKKSSSQLKSGPKYVEGVCKLEAKTSPDPNNLKVLVGKSSSEAYKSSTFSSHSPRNVPSQSTNRKQRGISNDNLGSRRDAGSFDGVKDEGRVERSKKITKDTPEACISPSSKVSKSSRFSHGSVSKGSSADPKESSLHSSPKGLAPSVTAVSSLAESTKSLKNPVASNAHTKVVGSCLPEKSEKTSQHDSQSSSKVNASQMQPPASSNPLSGLSDEELALLLHQELNSSPRVPRVPRMRHAGSLPQLTSPTAASMLMKRTSSSGGKDFNSSSRRKSKESGKDGALNARDISDEAKKVERVSPSPDHRGQASAITTNPLTKGEVESGLPKDLTRKNKPSVATATTSSGLSSYAEVNERKMSRYSPRHASNGDSGAVGRPTPLTLPGLIARIMSKGERMTLEELCDAVLPHWPHLRKHNGEPYAYSSHSNAVLDCLRNRSEWARLVDRGPKISTSKKRRKSDAEPSGAESEDNARRERTSKDGSRSKSLESQQEEFPKGKRQARKRRRLAPNGREIKGFRRRRRVEVVSDDEDGSRSNSSDDSKFSEDETQGDGTSGTNEASTSSDETSN